MSKSSVHEATTYVMGSIEPNYRASSTSSNSSRSDSGDDEYEMTTRPKRGDDDFNDQQQPQTSSGVVVQLEENGTANGASTNGQTTSIKTPNTDQQSTSSTESVKVFWPYVRHLLYLCCCDQEARLPFACVFFTFTFIVLLICWLLTAYSGGPNIPVSYNTTLASYGRFRGQTNFGNFSQEEADVTRLSLFLAIVICFIACTACVGIPLLKAMFRPPRAGSATTTGEWLTSETDGTTLPMAQQQQMRWLESCTKSDAQELNATSQLHIMQITESDCNAIPSHILPIPMYGPRTYYRPQSFWASFRRKPLI